MKKLLILLLIAVCQTTASAQTRKFRWGTDSCSYESTYNARRYSPAQIEDTSQLLRLIYFPETVYPTPKNPENITSREFELLDKEYETRTNRLKNLNLVKTAYWQTLRQTYLKNLEQIYQLARATMAAYRDPLKLKDIKFADACVVKYADPIINGGDPLLELWQIENEKIRLNHSRPDIVKKEFDEKFNSPDKFRYARLDLLSYNWWNCVNNAIARDDNYAAHQKEFKKLFTKTRTIECETEP